MKINQIWNGIFPFEEIDGEPLNGSESGDHPSSFSFCHLKLEVVVVIYIEDSMIEIGDLEGETEVKLLFQVSEEEIWSVTEKLLDSIKWGLVFIEEASQEAMIQQAKEFPKRLTTTQQPS